jgi:hypothetical protein
MSNEMATATIHEVSPEGMTLSVHAFGHTRDVHTPSLHPQAEQFFLESCQGGTNLDDALAVWSELMDPYLSMRPSGDPRCSVVVVESGPLSGDDLVAWGRLLARLQTPECKTVMVCGGVVVDQSSDYDTLGALAAALIRQRLGFFIGVGIAAKPIATQVGLEGSWDGESVWAETVAQAYDYLCDQVHESDVVVVVGLQQADLADLITRWGGVVR